MLYFDIGEFGCGKTDKGLYLVHTYFCRRPNALLNPDQTD